MNATDKMSRCFSDLLTSQSSGCSQSVQFGGISTTRMMFSSKTFKTLSVKQYKTDLALILPVLHSYMNWYQNIVNILCHSLFIRLVILSVSQIPIFWIVNLGRVLLAYMTWVGSNFPLIVHVSERSFSVMR